MTARTSRWLLIDGSSLIFRAFYGVPGSVRAPDGTQINAVRGFLETLARLIDLRSPQRIAVASDEDWRPQHRVDLIASYKAHRVAEPIPPALIPQMKMIHEVLDAIGVDFIGAPALEAEDVIASWAEQIDGTVEIVSGDRDLFALVEDPRVVVLYPEKGAWAPVDEAAVTARYGIPGRSYAQYAVLRGDPSDGLPGLAGVGAKTAAALINRYGSVQAIIDSGTRSEADCQYLERALRVVMPGSPDPVPLPEGIRTAYPHDAAALSELESRLGIASSARRLVTALGTMAHGAAPA